MPTHLCSSQFQSFQPFNAHGSSKFKGSTFNEHTPFSIFRIASCSEARPGWDAFATQDERLAKGQKGK
jgi:hypothetical protein